ncbi:MAG: ABC transporter ATP-binding protein [Oscillospiraceae bacterium]|nr:ABC transporter ATP-binding protein [Oscillospiraceae bacterium]
MQLNYPLPTESAAVIEPVLSGEEILYCLPYDLTASGQFTEGFLVITKTRLAVINGGEIERVVPVNSLDGICCGELNSSGMLEANPTGDPFPIVFFTMEHMARYSMAERIITDLIDGVQPRAVSTDDEKKCPNCGRPFIRNTRICRHCSDRMGVLKRIWKVSRPCWGYYALLLLIFWANSGFMLYSPYVSKRLIDEVLTKFGAGSELLPHLLWLVALTGLCSLATTIIGALREIVSAKASNLFVRDLRNDIYKKVQSMPLGYIEEKNAGDLMHRINGDTGRIQQFIQNVAVQAINEICLFIGVAIVVVSFNPMMALLILIPIPIALFLINRISSSVRRRYHKQWRWMDKLTDALNNVFNGIKVVKVFGQEEREVKHFESVASSVRDITCKTEQYVYTVFPIIRFLIGFGSYFVTMYGGALVLGKQMELGELMQFSTYAGYLYSRLEWFSMLPRHISQAITSAQRVFEVMDEDVPPVPTAPLSADGIEGYVDFNNVTFGYKSYKSVLKNIDLNVQKGEMIGLVGHSGAGKSTMINLLMRLYKADEGEIKLDGNSLEDYSISDYKNNLGVVLQESYLFSGSILNNIRYARPDASDDECIRAAKIANAHEFIINLPDGYDTYVGEKGQRLSGGERQRIAIARAVLSDPKIMILDEATASVDTETEQQIQEALGRIIKGRTTFAIAHRLSTLKNANRLVVLEEGRVAEVGSHNELMEKDGIYAGLVRAQRTMTALSVAIDDGGGRGGPGGRGPGRGGPPPR